MSHYLIFLALIPIASFQLAKMQYPSRLWFITGLSAGLVIAPVSHGLVDYTLIPLVGNAIGLVGALLNLIHGSVGYFMLVALGEIAPGAVLFGPELAAMHLINAVIWTSYYGIVGYRLDLRLSAKQQKKYAPLGWDNA